MPLVTILYGEETKTIEAPAGSLLGDVIAQTELPLEQPCAGRGTCGKCKVLVEMGAAPLDETERRNLTPGELALDNRLACRARVESDVRVILSPIVVYSNKIFHASRRYKQEKDAPLGLAIDLGTTTVAAFLTMLDSGEVCAGAAALNQQTVYGADVISRLNAAASPEHAERLHRLALASINQAVDALKLPKSIHARVERVSVVGNAAMHHLLAGLPTETLAVLPFQPYSTAAIKNATSLMDGIFTEGVKVRLPPLIGGFVGSDALACLAYFGFEHAPQPMAAIDLGTNGEVMVTDGKRMLAASTAAGPAFEGVNISCGSRAVDGAVVRSSINEDEIILQTIADAPPVGLTGSGLISLVHSLRRAGLIESSGRIAKNPPAAFARYVTQDPNGVSRIQLTPDGHLHLSQFDIRELQKAKGAIRAVVNILMEKLGLQPEDLGRVLLTGSFGGQVEVASVLGLGMLPPVRPEVVETLPNGAGLGAAMFLSDEGFALGEHLAARTEQVDLDMDADFQGQYVGAMMLGI
jgi:uncharacterized 2Fe-2S/4Fe-4S cluster protein (DUF4445 family)